MAFYKPAGSLTECQDRPWTTLKISEDNHQESNFGGYFCTDFEAQISAQNENYKSQK